MTTVNAFEFQINEPNVLVCLNGLYVIVICEYNSYDEQNCSKSGARSGYHAQIYTNAALSN